MRARVKTDLCTTKVPIAFGEDQKRHHRRLYRIDSLAAFVQSFTSLLLILDKARASICPHDVSITRVRAIIYWIVLVALIGLITYGLVTHSAILSDAWTGEGRLRFLLFAGGYFMAASAIYIFAASRLALIIAGVALVACCGAVGLAGPVASGLFFFSSMVLGKSLLFGREQNWTGQPVDMLLATLFGGSLYMTAIGLTAALPIHYAVLHAALITLPFVIWPAATRDCARYLATLIGRQQWTNVWEYAAFALAAFIPLTHLVSVLLPLVNSDAVVVHLAVPSVVANEHAWPFDVKRYAYAVSPMGASWMMLPAYLLGGEYGARLVNFSFFVGTALLLYTILRRFVSAATGWLLVAVYELTPFFQLETGNTYIESIWTALLFGSVIAMDLLRTTGYPRYLLATSVLSASSVAVKVLGAIVAGMTLGFAALHCRRRVALVAAAFILAALCGLYPYIHAFLLTGNPVFPYMNDVFHAHDFAPTAFVGLDRTVPPNPYQLTFATQPFADGGAGNGSLGFAYLVLFPVALLAVGRKYPFLGWFSLSAAIVATISEFKLAEVNLRYLYVILPFGMIAVAIAYAHACSLSKPVFAALCAFGVGVTLVNIYAMPVSGWAHRDFDLWRALTRADVNEYRNWGAPERRLIDYLNLTRGRTVRVAFFSRPMLIDLKGDGIFTNWYNYEVATKMAAAKTPGAVFRLMREEHVTSFIAFKPESHIAHEYPSVDGFLRTYTEPEFSAGDAYLARLKPEYGFANEIITNGDFAHGLERWTAVGVPPSAGTEARNVLISGAGGYRQNVPIDDRLMYRYAVTASCSEPDTHVKLHIMWQNKAGHDIGDNLDVRPCKQSPETLTEDITPPAGARGAEVDLLGLTADHSVEIFNVSLKW